LLSSFYFFYIKICRRAVSFDKTTGKSLIFLKQKPFYFLYNPAEPKNIFATHIRI